MVARGFGFVVSFAAAVVFSDRRVIISEITPPLSA
jgi:hypothetical protein